MKMLLIALCALFIAPLSAAAQTVDCDALHREAVVTGEALLEVELDEPTERALAVYRELLRPGAQIRLFPETVGVDERPINLHELDEAFADWKAAVDALFAAELAAEAVHKEAEGPWVEAIMAVNDAVTAGHCNR